MLVTPYHPRIARRFRGYLPVVVDVETAGFDAQRHALLEIAAIPLYMSEDAALHPGPTLATHVEPFSGAEIDPKALAFTGIDPDHPFRDAVPELKALQRLFRPIRQAVKTSGCNRAILVGHNAAFDLAFVNAAVRRSGHKRNPFHPFSTLDTVTLAALAFGQTVLAKAMQAAEIDWDEGEAHSAVYDAEKTAQLFCAVLNRWHSLCGTAPWLALQDGPADR